MKFFNRKNRGAIALTSMIILGAVIILIVSSTTLLGVSSRHNALQLGESVSLLMKSEGCMEEGLIQLSRDDTYTGDSYTVDNADCTVVVSGSGDSRTMTVDVVEDVYYHYLTLDIQLNPTFAILDFSY